MKYLSPTTHLHPTQEIKKFQKRKGVGVGKGYISEDTNPTYLAYKRVYPDVNLHSVRKSRELSSYQQ